MVTGCRAAQACEETSRNAVWSGGNARVDRRERGSARPRLPRGDPPAKGGWRATLRASGEHMHACDTQFGASDVVSVTSYWLRGPRQGELLRCVAVVPREQRLPWMRVGPGGKPDFDVRSGRSTCAPCFIRAMGPQSSAPPTHAIHAIAGGFPAAGHRLAARSEPRVGPLVRSQLVTLSRRAQDTALSHFHADVHSSPAFSAVESLSAEVLPEAADKSLRVAISTVVGTPRRSLQGTAARPAAARPLSAHRSQPYLRPR
jgi:hypothetical protein